MATLKLEVEPRMSHLSILSHADRKASQYNGVKTPDIMLQDDALREGGRPELFTKDYIGVIAQYAAVGLVYGTLPATLYPLLQEYLNASGATYVTADTLVGLPWSFKLFYGILSDCVPIFGYRRRPYMLIGWAFCLLVLVLMGCSPVGAPYYPDPAYRKLDVNSTEYAAVKGTFNTEATDKAPSTSSS